MPVCDRCGREAIGTTLSYFNTETICWTCSDEERQHPKFAAAQDVEELHVIAGNYNFEGVGLPDELRIQARERTGIVASK